MVGSLGTTNMQDRRGEEVVRVGTAGACATVPISVRPPLERDPLPARLAKV